jgi:hypothetical protein
MNKRIIAIATAAALLALIPLAGATPTGPRTYTTVYGICLSVLPHAIVPMKSMNAVIVYYTIHQPLHPAKHGVFLMQHVTFTGEFVGHVRYCMINGEFAGTPIIAN